MQPAVFDLGAAAKCSSRRPSGLRIRIKAARGAARAAASAPRPSLSLARRSGPGQCRSAGAKGSGQARRTRGSQRAAANLTRGPLAAAPSGLCGRPGKAARSWASVQPPPPCQIRRSVGTDRAGCHLVGKLNYGAQRLAVLLSRTS
jgi:hypothetical protein